MRSIFGREFTENLSKEIFVRPSQATKCRDKAAHIYQPEPLEVEDCVQPQLQPRDDVNQNYHNNEMNEHGIYREDNHDGEFSQCLQHAIVNKI